MKVGTMLLFPVRLFYSWLFFPVYKKRLATAVASLCESHAKILDVGCNDGYVASLIMAQNPTLSITGVDIQENMPARIDRKLYDGKHLPFPDNSFDIVMALDVLHHTKDIKTLLADMKRVSKRHIIIKDHREYGPGSHFLISLADYMSNAPYGIPCVYNYFSIDAWKALFGKLGLTVVAMPSKLSFGFGLTQRYNPIFKLEKEE